MGCPTTVIRWSLSWGGSDIRSCRHRSVLYLFSFFEQPWWDLFIFSTSFLSRILVTVHLSLWGTNHPSKPPAEKPQHHPHQTPENIRKKNSTTYPANEYYTPNFEKDRKVARSFWDSSFSLRLPDQRALCQGCASSHPKAGSCFGGHPRRHGWHGTVFELHPERSSKMSQVQDIFWPLKINGWNLKIYPFWKRKIIFHPTSIFQKTFQPLVTSGDLNTSSLFSQIFIQTQKKRMEFPSTNLRTHQWYLEPFELIPEISGTWKKHPMGFFRWLLFANS